jgi:hypothetical protein
MKPDILSKMTIAIALASVIVASPLCAAAPAIGQETLGPNQHIVLYSFQVDYQSQLHYSITILNGTGMQLRVLDDSNYLAWHQGLSFSMLPCSSSVTNDTTVDANLGPGTYYVVGENPTSQLCTFSYDVRDSPISDPTIWLTVGIAMTVIAAVLVSFLLVGRWAKKRPSAPSHDFCEVCGEDLPQNATVCPHCGERKG